MDRKRYEIKNNVFILLLSIVLFFIVLFCIKKNIFGGSKTQSGQLTKFISLDNYQLSISLDKLNSSKQIGEIHTLHLNGVVNLGIQKITITDSEITICNDIENCKDCFYDNEECIFKIGWYGGNLRIRTLYKNGQFEILEEHYSAGI